MNIRKHWKKILLSSAALFWASCGGDSESTPTAGPCGDCGEFPSSSSEALPKSSSDDAVSSSSEEASSSSEAISSSSMDMPYRLASDTTIACSAAMLSAGNGCLDPVEVVKVDSPEEIMRKLQENRSLTLEELSQLEDDLLGEPIDVPLYGVRPYTCVHHAMNFTYMCSDGKQYIVQEGNPAYVLKDSLLYTMEEYEAKFPKSSSSSEAESSSSEEVGEPPSPLCQKSDFTNAQELQEKFQNDKDAIVDSVKTAEGDSLDEQKAKCLKSVYKASYLCSFSGYVAKTQTCDGESVVNPRYQAMLDSNRVYVERQIDMCLNPPE